MKPSRDINPRRTLISIIKQSSFVKYTFTQHYCAISTTFFNATYPDEDTQNTTGGSRTRKSRGMVMYRCLHCPADKPWANRTRDNAWHHARRCHADIISSLDRTLIGGSSDVLYDEREVKRPRIDAFFPSRYSDGGYIEIKGKHIRGYPAWQLISSQSLLNHLILSLTSHRRGVRYHGIDRA
ncbi:Uncharacterized protein HZ326_22934 [Fusarium oxysporum f. sp. albedinis]|nr:Uncharacterized protein HZ326_22934 [Fusarium oxysporum f. sp. albedinis]